MSDLLKRLDRLYRMKIVKVDTNPMGVILKDSKRGPLVNFEQVKTVIGQWVADHSSETADQVADKLVTEWMDEVGSAAHGADWDDLADLKERIAKALQEALSNR